MLAGHVLRGALVIALGLAAAAVTDGAASAAVLTLAITLGTWALDFIGQVRGGTRHESRAIHARFRRSRVRARRAATRPRCSSRLVLIGRCSRSRSMASAGRDVRVRASELLSDHRGGSGLACVAAARVNASWDASEDRRSSFAAADETCAADDSRAALGDGASRTRRSAARGSRERCAAQAAADTAVGARRRTRRAGRPGSSRARPRTTARSGIGSDGREAMTRSTTVPIVLETIYGLAGLTPPTAARRGRVSRVPARRAHPR